MCGSGLPGPFATLPQLVKLYFTQSHHAAGRSLVTWSLYAVLSLLWLIHGLILREPPIYPGNGIALVLNSLMVARILIHAGLTY